MGNPVLGLQLASLRNEVEIDFIGTLWKIKEMGFEAVEFAGFYQLPSKKLKAALEEMELKPLAAHIPLNYENPKKTVGDLKQQVEYAAEIGIPYIVSPWFPLPKKPIETDVKQYVDIACKCSKAVREGGLRFCVSHLESDFKTIGEKMFIERILEQMPPEELSVEFHLGWMKYADVDIKRMLSRYKDRIPMVRLVDYKKGHTETELGEGVVGYDELYPYIADLGIPAVILEQTQFTDRKPMESLKKSLGFLQRAGKARG